MKEFFEKCFVTFIYIVSFVLLVLPSFVFIKEMVDWLKYGTWIKISIMSLSFYAKQDLYYPKWIGLQKILSWIYDQELWILCPILLVFLYLITLLIANAYFRKK